ncbi:hypothetical protein [Halobacillus amylolyticus]|uniref:Sigma-O factor regulatory protein RsoA n=1 Tax=Halobacillus amylolyticus TaxID=2932259 RepID=A0ABY4HHY8_9BACI|nr:hypothetical protein [Halobacillus amylolyticus]UOR14191.1 hypothetical protein MUO15_21145 [Halobacillus amylolyticus]
MSNQEEILEYINLLEPKIKKVLYQTHFEEREDLEQSIKLKILENAEKITNLETIGFFEFKERIAE